MAPTVYGLRKGLRGLHGLSVGAFNAMIGVFRPILTAVLVDGDYASTVGRFSCPSDPAVQEFPDDVFLVTGRLRSYTCFGE